MTTTTVVDVLHPISVTEVLEEQLTYLLERVRP